MTAPSLLDELEEVVRLAEKATPGPWETFNGHLIRYCEGELCTSIAEMRSPYRRNVGIMRGEEEQRINLKLIVELVNFIRTNHATLADMAKRMEAAEMDARVTKRSAETLCRIYFEIAAEAVGEDKVRAERDRRIHATQEDEE